MNLKSLVARAAGPTVQASDGLGPLSQLPGLWRGTGFNMIAVPNKQNGTIFRLIVNPTLETIQFAPTGGVPNRGSLQGDITLFGVTYLQQVSDSSNNEPIHVEPGIWLNIPATTDPASGPTIARQSTIPHGDSVLATGTASSEERAPNIDPVSTLPFPLPGQPALPLGYTDPYLHGTPLPPGFDLLNPNQSLINTLNAQKEAGLTITNTINLIVNTGSNTTTAPGTPGMIENIPFIVSNANATNMSCIFWIETVQRPDGSQFLQLQYTQTVFLVFDGVVWPHVSVATLVKQS